MIKSVSVTLALAAATLSTHSLAHARPGQDAEDASVITYPGSDNAQFVVEGPPGAILSKEVVG